ncbi:MAG: Dihydrolipoyl dehydrogenase [Chlamydiia bacterium]|nr:Dihydrolipoyl dehydrogenase [Chlamydiia bacterium]MCH9618867.1 Dihydrolipoyl dehydrogenase [Chlamydiia bacterium]MCH9623972.1 Dihydrolipoyl dehydrogenase [Chlamydiia bacterium]
MDYDVVVIGGGPGGYVSAIKAAHLGLKVAIVDKDRMGGTCLLRGCIPTKSLLAHASVLKTVKTAEHYGIDIQRFSFDYSKMKEKKDSIVSELSNGVNTLLKAAGVDSFSGIASFVDKNTIKIKGREVKKITAEKVIIATGSIPMTLPFAPVDGKIIHDSTSILEITTVPKHLIVIGGGYIGCEFASLFHELNAKVTIIEMFDKLVLTQGKKIADALTTKFGERGINLVLGKGVDKVEVDGDQVTCALADGSAITGDALLVSTGRKPFTDRLHLDAIGLGTNKRGFIEVDDHLETNVSGVYAIGDVTGKSMLAHTASYQGVVAAENIAGHEKSADYSCIPAVIFTDPEIAQVGYTLEGAKEAGIDAESALFPFAALGKAKAMLKDDGFVEIVYGKKHREVLGGTALGYNASILIAEIALAQKNELTLEAIADTIHAHPTMAEAWAEASELGMGQPIHLPRR